jgi:L-ribulose-5-phosphate 3-epimerase
MLTRRSLLKSSLTAAAASALLPNLRGNTMAEPWFKISLAQWSLHNALYAGELDALDFPKVAREDYGCDGVEYVNSFFKDKATDFDYLAELKARAAKYGVQNVLIMIDGEGHLADEDDEARRTAIENHVRWIAAAKFLGCHSIRVNVAGGGKPEEQAARGADSLRRLARIGDQYAINVIVENHGGWSSNGEWLAGVMKAANHPRVGTLPDFGNFRMSEDREYDRYLGVEQLMPFAKGVSAKSWDFGDDGFETKMDFPRLLEIVRAAGYRGFIGIEYEGDRMSEPEGIRATKKLLERIRDGKV